MINRIQLTLEQYEYSALLTAAIADLRSPGDEARYFLRLELRRRGLLPEEMTGNESALSTSAKQGGTQE